MDLAATDILRHRELGVPRYSEFRRLLHLRAPTTFDELTDEPGDRARRCTRCTTATSSDVDLMVGLFAERPPDGFAFSDTAFRIFILMASRRLNSDRFFTTRLHARRLHQQGLALDRGQRPWPRCCCATGRSCARDARRGATRSCRGRHGRRGP